MLTVLRVDCRRVDLRMRLPFRYGIATMTEVPHVLVTVEAEIEGRRAVGIAADHLPPKWFTKDPARAVGDEIEDMVAVLRHAMVLAEGRRTANAFTLWRELAAEQAAWGRAAGHPALLHHFGVTLVERAVIDACCRCYGQPFHRLVQGEVLGIDLAAVHPELAGRRVAELLPPTPLAAVTLRHTVGLGDPIEAGDAPEAERPADGLPWTLAENIRRYGLRHFKIKIQAGRPDETWPRLRRMARVLGERVGEGLAVTLDGNEGFASVEAFRAFWEELQAQPDWAPLGRALLFVEQPFHRDRALGPEVAQALPAWPGRPPIIIDESGAEPADLRRALEIGYVGTSHKNCKGVFQGVVNAALLAHRRRTTGARLLMSGEDLSNVGPVALPQDLAVQAVLGNASVERNGHHYAPGLSFCPPAVQSAALAAHGDLYEPSPAGWPTLRIRDGVIALGSVNAAPFGVAPAVMAAWWE